MCIGCLLRKQGDPPVAIEERETLRKPFLLVDDSRPVFFLFASVHNLHAFPISDMPIFAFAKAAVHHSRCAQERHMTLMQTRQRPTGKFWLCRMCYTLCLAPCRRI